MIKPSSFSVTDVPCRCGYFVHNVGHPNFPVKLNVELNEYYLDHTLPTGAVVSMVFYHCPLCGGVASVSQRDKLFVEVPEHETDRLGALIQGIKESGDIERALGAPDEDKTFTPPADFLQANTSNPGIGPIRVVTYTKLSETAVVQFTVYSNGRVEKALFGKQISGQVQ